MCRLGCLLIAVEWWQVRMLLQLVATEWFDLRSLIAIETLLEADVPTVGKIEFPLSTTAEETREDTPVSTSATE